MRNDRPAGPQTPSQRTNILDGPEHLNASWTPTSEPRMCGYRVVFDKSIPLGEARIVSAEGDTIATLDLIHGGYTLHPAPMRAQAKDWGKPLLCECGLPESFDSSAADTLSPNWTPTPSSSGTVEEARQKAYVYYGQSDNVEEVDALIAAVRSSTLREVREMVEGMEGLTATVSAFSHWSETEPSPTKFPELEGVFFVRRSDILAGLAKMEGQ